MKLRTIKQHYYEGILCRPGYEYNTDVVIGGRMVRNGLCKEIEPKRRVKPKGRKR